MKANFGCKKVFPAPLSDMYKDIIVALKAGKDRRRWRGWRMSRKYKAIKKGDTIGVLAFSSPCHADLLAKGLKTLDTLGFRYKLALEPAKYYGSTTYLFSSDSIENRASAFKEFLLDQEIAAILSVRGAYGSLELLPSLLAGSIGEVSKPVIGFSDTTALLIHLQQKLGIPAIHGPSLLAGFADFETDPAARKNVKSLIKMLETGETEWNDELEPLFNFEDSDWGPLVGGNLSVLSSLIGTPSAPNFSGALLCLEEVSEKPYRIHRMLLQMKLSGLFDDLRGVILGEFKNCEHALGVGPELKDVLRDIFSALKIPVFLSAPFGHGAKNLPFPIGVRARVHAKRLELGESLVLN
jgi:muramoyltetrapeptide carboxypeptidase